MVIVFISYEIKLLRRSVDDNCLFDVAIHDDKFDQSVQINTNAYYTNTKSTIYPLIISAAIEIYSTNHMNVAKNLYLIIRQIDSKESVITINSQMDYYSEYCPAFKDYISDIKKYLLFS